VFLHFFIKKDKANVPKYIFKHMIKTLKESQLINRAWIPYGRLISEILNQGGFSKGLSETRGFTDDMMGIVTGKIINGSTLANLRLIKQEAVTNLETYLKESRVSSNLMEEFPPICKQDPLDVQLFYIHDHLQSTGEEIQLEDILEEMYGGSVKVAKSRKTKRKPMTEAEYLEDASEQPARKAKKAKKDKAFEANGSEVATIWEEVKDLEADKILPKRTISGKANTTSQSASEQPSTPKRKRKNVVKKLKESRYVEDEEQVAEATQLVSREVRRKKVNDDVV